MKSHFLRAQISNKSDSSNKSNKISTQRSTLASQRPSTPMFDSKSKKFNSNSSRPQTPSVNTTERLLNRMETSPSKSNLIH